MKIRGFDRLAPAYRALEYLAFGRDLERARWSLLHRLSGCSSILVLGEGDGRCLERLVRVAPDARIDCVEASGAMIARAKRRLPPEASGRVRFHAQDALEFKPAGNAHDAAVTLFFLDCFTAAEAEAIVRTVAGALRPGARWLVADFAIPPHGIRRLRARLWVGMLYAFFRWETGISARRLPPYAAMIERAGFRRVETRRFQWGMLETVLYSRE